MGSITTSIKPFTVYLGHWHPRGKENDKLEYLGENFPKSLQTISVLVAL